MSCPYHYDEPEKKKDSSTVAAGIVLGLLAAGSIAFSLTKRKKDQNQEVKGNHNVKLFEKKETPQKDIGREFYMPHFLIKNLTVTPAETGIAVRVDYKIDEVLYNYLMHNTPHYTFRMTLPEEYRALFEGEGTVSMLGELVYGTGDKRDYAVTFNFKKRDDAAVETIAEMSPSTGQYKMDIVDDQLKVLNNFDDVYSAANIIRY